MSEKLLKIATITAAHGIQGEIRLKVFLEDKDAFADLGPYLNVKGEALGNLNIRGRSKEQLIARMDGATTRNAAEALKGLNIFIPRSRLPEPEDADEFYVEDLIGLAVVEDGTPIGKIKSVRDHGAGDLVEIEFADAKTDYYAFTLANFPTVSLAQGQVTFVAPTQVVAQDDEGKVH